jgi:poly(3-hydroxybutyrate) depolymerase
MDSAMTTTAPETGSASDSSTERTEMPAGVPARRRPRPGSGTCPPGLVDAGIDSGFGIANALVTHGTHYWTRLLQRRATGLEVATDWWRWQSTMLARRRPTWASPHRIVREWPLARLRDFSPTEPDDVVTPAGAAAAVPDSAVPVLVLPPQAGHDSCIVDYAPGQSQVATALRAGCRQVFSMDWVGATAATKDCGIDDYLTLLREAVTDLGGRVHLVGDCQGGWLAVIYAAVHPETVASLTIAGAPVDYHSGEPLIHDWLQVVSPGGDMSFYRAAVAANGGVLPGDFLLTGFKMIQPEAEVERRLGLLAHLDEPAYVARFEQFDTWFEHTQPIPGAFYLWIVEHLFMNNELVHGDLVVGAPDGGTQRVDLGRIDCPLFLLAGSGDHITPPAQVFALADFASTPADQVTRLTTGGGHLGLFMGHDALDNYWSVVFGELATLA